VIVTKPPAKPPGFTELMRRLGRINQKRDELLKQVGLEAPKVHPWAQLLSEIHILERKLAWYAQASGHDGCLAAARVVEALKLCLQAPAIYESGQHLPDVAAEFRKVATQLLRVARLHGVQQSSRYPSNLGRWDRAAAVLAQSVEVSMERGETDSHSVACYMEISRALNQTSGTQRVLPHDGTAEERVALFAEAIEKQRNRTTGGDVLDPESLVSACARACGNRRELFGAVRKREKRAAQRS
jgi:hypothetical protein